MATSTIQTPYQRRRDLVARTIEAHSDMKADVATDLAVHVLRALDSIPETMR
jgi:hypothetical protein